MGKLEVIMVLIILILGATGMIFFFSLDEEGNLENPLEDGETEFEVNDEGLVVNENGEVVGEIISGGSGGGGSGGGGSGGSEQQLVCNLIPVAYSLRAFEQNFECTEYNVNGCSKLTAYCAVSLFNLDTLVGGDFVILRSLLDKGNGETLDTLSSSQYVDPLDSYRFETTFNLEDISGINEELNCDLEVIAVPNRQECYYV